MADEFEGSGTGQSLFNMGIASLNRIHNLLVEAHQCSLGVGATAEPHSDKQPVQQLRALDRIFIECRPYLKDDELAEILEARKELIKLFNKHPRPDVYQQLLEFEGLMRDSKWLKNMLHPTADDATLAFRS